MLQSIVDYRKLDTPMRLVRQCKMRTSLLYNKNIYIDNLLYYSVVRASFITITTSKKGTCKAQTKSKSKSKGNSKCKAKAYYNNSVSLPTSFSYIAYYFNSYKYTSTTNILNTTTSASYYIALNTHRVTVIIAKA